MRAEKVEENPDTAAAVAKEWLHSYVAKNTRSLDQIERIFNREVLPHWKHKLITEVGRDDVLRLIDGMHCRFEIAATLRAKNREAISPS